MPVTPRSRSGTASASTSPFKSNGRKQPARKTIELSEDEEIDEKKPARGRPSKAQTEEIDLVDDDDDEDDDATEEYEVETIRRHRPLKGDERVSTLFAQLFRPRSTGYQDSVTDRYTGTIVDLNVLQPSSMSCSIAWSI